jgi:cubilin
VLVSFSLFELETSEFCNEDYVELRKDSSVGPVIGVYCGTDIPSNITAAHNIWVRFQSSGTGTAPGFIADYSMCELQIYAVQFQLKWTQDDHKNTKLNIISSDKKH